MPDRPRMLATSATRAHEYEIHILQAEGLPTLVSPEIQPSDAAAIRSARKMARGRNFEVWRDLECISGRSSLTPLLTERQQREAEFYRSYAGLQSVTAMNFDILDSPNRRWWNAYWNLWTYLRTLDLRDKRVLVVGCGCGDDAILFAKLGAQVSAFDLSPHMLEIARARATISGVQATFEEMPSENLTYPDSTFDVIFARDILHHVEIVETMREIVRVAKPSALFVADEIYSHSLTERVRHNRWVEYWLYPCIKKIIYANEDSDITQDECKLTERDIELVKSFLETVSREDYFNFLVTRIISHNNLLFSKIDRCLLRATHIWGGKFLAGRILLLGPLRSTGRTWGPPRPDSTPLSQ